MDPYPASLISRSETELSLRWAEENPALFVDNVIAFQNAFPAPVWYHRIDLSRKGFVTLVAARTDAE